MKGPSLQYDLRVLRVFRCDACGREAQGPAHETSHTCACTDPPKFMRPLERPRTTSPDVAAFISPAEPEDTIEEELAEEPYVPYVPQLPPRPVQFPNRRRLSDEVEKYQPPEFGVGIEGPGLDERGESIDAESLAENGERSPRAEAPDNVSPGSEQRPRPQKDGRHRDQRDRGNRGRGDRGRQTEGNGPQQSQENTGRGRSDGSHSDAPQLDAEKSGVSSENSAPDATRRRSRGNRRRKDPIREKPSPAEPQDDFGSGLDRERFDRPPENGEVAGKSNDQANADGMKSRTDDSRPPRRRGRRRGPRRHSGPSDSGPSDSGPSPDALE